MKVDTFVKIVMAEILRSPDVVDTSFLRSDIRALGRKFESGALDAAGILEAISDILPWQLSRDIKKSIEKALR
ncbi:MAG: hypothetical protein ACEQSB_06045 [Undibacterium sp.]